MFLFCSHEYFAHTCVCTQLGILGAPKKTKGGIGFPLELEFQIIPTMRVLGIRPWLQEQPVLTAEPHGVWTVILSALKKENI